MKKILLYIGVLFIMLNIIGCGIKEKFVNEYEQAAEECDKIVDAIEKRDENALLNLFSTDALNEADDIEEGIQFVFQIYSGEVVENALKRRVISYDTGNR